MTYGKAGPGEVPGGGESDPGRDGSWGWKIDRIPPDISGQPTDDQDLQLEGTDCLPRPLTKGVK